jgi:hypothetical protein
MTEGSVDQWLGAIASFSAVVVALWLGLSAKRDADKAQLLREQRANEGATLALLHAYVRLQDLAADCRKDPPSPNDTREMANTLEATETAARHALAQRPTETALVDAAFNALGTAAELRAVCANVVPGTVIRASVLREVMDDERYDYFVALAAALKRRHGPELNHAAHIAELEALWPATD